VYVLCVCVCLCVCTCVRAYVYLTGSRRVLLHYSVLQASYQGLEERVGKLAALQRGWLRGGGRNSPYLGLVNLYRIFCRESMEFTAIYGVYVRLWPTLHILPWQRPTKRQGSVTMSNRHSKLLYRNSQPAPAYTNDANQPALRMHTCANRARPSSFY